MSTVYGEDSGKDNHQYSARQKLQPRSNGTRAISVIFSFTHRAHLPLLAICFTLSALAGTIQPVTSILVGKLMNSLSRYAANDIDGDEFEANTKPWLISLAMLGTAACFLRGSFCCAWIVFGESQARVVREDLFSSLVIRDFEWFEAQSSGVSSLLSRIQVYENKYHCCLIS